MLNEIKPPPLDPYLVPHPLRAAHQPAQPHVDSREPGLHHPRIMGEPTHIDPEYAMPMEDRGSTFSIGLSISVILIVVVVLIAILWSVYR